MFERAHRNLHGLADAFQIGRANGRAPHARHEGGRGGVDRKRWPTCACVLRTNATCSAPGRADIIERSILPRQPSGVRRRAAPLPNGSCVHVMRRSVPGARNFFDRVNDRLIAGTAAVVADRASRMASRDGTSRRARSSAAIHQHPGRAKPALHGIAPPNAS